ncbi:hypothetical protein G7075_04745 [Phycicoccus sp. HDW14]|uniref:hypothetical protein n=1 Tax=Phycicoccus sp. HDW14 TaxID=2714941 RepID=UPI00140E4484|nr:hypothetical protein [Phycicoccus sp. HDW14]QIM20619.1 hypothetical protein G7075_04745 [Phycicoccus sp. HDW14]
MKSLTRRMLSVLAGMLLVMAIGAHSLAAKEPPDGDILGDLSDTGSVVKTLNRANVDALSTHYFRNVTAKGPFYDYAAVSACSNAGPGENEGDLCPASWGLCRVASGGGEGPAVTVFQRQVTRAGAPLPGSDGEWQRVDLTCWPERVPGNANALTMTMIRNAFHDTDFTKPTVNIQPEGDVTLVNLPTFFEVKFPEAGFGPEEIDRPDPARLLGYSIEVRPRLKSVTYHLGERTIGPTTDLGGRTRTAPSSRPTGSPARSRSASTSSTPASSGSAAAGGSTSPARSTSRARRRP